MNLLLQDTNKILDIALKTSSLPEMILLKNHPLPLIRRVLAKNKNLTQDIINSLLYDPVENVSYIASINPNNRNYERVFEDLRPCVICNEDERTRNCLTCKKNEEHSF